MASKLGGKVLLAAGGAVVAGLVVYFCVPHAKHRTMAKVVKKPYVKPDLPGFIQAHANDKDPVIQDKVGEARMHLAFAKANETWKAPKDPALKRISYEAARQTFLAAAKTKGQGLADPNYGTISEQAAYQAAVCLVAENKPEQAKQEFTQFMQQRPLSPLCKACYDRINRINGTHTQNADDLYQVDVAAQEKHVRFETSVCGPKAIAALLPLLGKPPKTYQEVAKLCGTTDTGTSIEGMRKGLKALGIESFGFELNAVDFDKLHTPVLLLRSDHFLVIEKIDGKQAEIYDPTTKQLNKTNLPKPDDGDFSASVITLSIPKLTGQ